MVQIIHGVTPTASTEAVAASIALAIQKRVPFSLVRIGDGDGHVLGFEDETSRDDIDRILRMWFGDNKISDHDVRHIQGMLREAIADADILGIPNRPNHEYRWRRVPRLISKYELWDGRKGLCSANVHIDLHQSDLYGKVLQDLPWLGLISPRNVSERVGRHWNIGRVERYDIPEEANYARHPHRVRRHYPDRFNELMGSIKIPFLGAPFLVGAGVLGKIYCRRIKELGGIAVDIGSVFDCWAYKNSRGSVKKMRLGL